MINFFLKLSTGLIVCFLIVFSCEKTQGQSTVKDSDGNPMLLGKQTRSDLEKPPFNEWFKASYEDAKLNDSVLVLLREELKDVQIKVFMGTWCGDSQLHVPQFFHIMDELGYETNTNFELITMSEQKTTSDGLEKKYDIKRVPTFIFYKGGVELNRIVESPKISLEQDILDILQSKGYK